MYESTTLFRNSTDSRSDQVWRHQSQSLDDPEWLVLLPASDEKPEEHEELIAAEKEAREKQVGLWKEELQQ